MNLMTSSHTSERAGIHHTHSPASLALSLIDGVRNAVLLSQSEMRLKEFSSLVVTSVLSMDDAAVIDEYSGHEFLPLISRLNQEVALYLQKQTHALTAQTPRQIWTIHQAEQLSDEQQSIIFRLIEQFPALPFRWIWLSSRPLQAWESHAGSDSVLWDLDAIELPRHNGDRATQDTREIAADHPDVPAAAMPTTTAQWPHDTAKKNLQMAFALLGTVVLGGLAWLWVTSLSASGPDKKAPAATDNNTRQVIALTPPITPTDSANKAPPEIALTGAQWLQALPTDSYVVEHGSFDTLEQAQNFQAKHKDLSTARIIAVRKTPDTEDWQFTMVTGHFRNEDRAKRYVSRLGWRASARIRATDKLKPLVVSTP